MKYQYFISFKVTIMIMQYFKKGILKKHCQPELPPLAHREAEELGG